MAAAAAPFWSEPLDALYARVDASPRGLTRDEATRRLRDLGADSAIIVVIAGGLLIGSVVVAIGSIMLPYVRLGHTFGLVPVSGPPEPCHRLTRQ